MKFLLCAREIVYFSLIVKVYNNYLILYRSLSLNIKNEIEILSFIICCCLAFHLANGTIQLESFSYKDIKVLSLYENRSLFLSFYVT